MFKEYIDNDGAYLLKEEPKSQLDKFATNLAKQDYEERFYYLATPYTKNEHEDAYQCACQMAMFLEDNGIFTFSPIAHSHGLSQYTSKENKLSHEKWLTIDFKYVKLSRGLLVCMMDGWKESFGIAREIEFAKTIKKPIIYTNFMEIPKEFLDEIYTTS